MVDVLCLFKKLSIKSFIASLIKCDPWSLTSSNGHAYLITILSYRNLAVTTVVLVLRARTSTHKQNYKGLPKRPNSTHSYYPLVYV